MKNAFTLIELVVVIIIIGVLSTLAVNQYSQAREQALYNEARANLRLILAAERVNRMERDLYVACADAVTINASLHLLLPTNSPAWNYSIKTYNTAASFCAQASRNNPDSAKDFRIQSPDLAGTSDPVVEENATCP